jgi:capsular polysaccharide biosynthesis protein
VKSSSRELINLYLKGRYAIAWAEEFLKFKDEARSKVIDKTATYILQEIRKTELTLEKNQADITEFQKQNNIASAKEVGDGQRTLENTKEKLSSSGSDTQTRSQQRYEQLKESETRTKLVLDNLRKTIDTINLTPSSEAQIEIVERGVGSLAPIGPKRARMILMGLFMGLAAGLGIVYFLRGLKGSDN